MKIGVIHYRSRLSETSRELIETIEKLGHRSVYLKIHELDSYIDNGSLHVRRFSENVDIDGGIVRSLGLYLTIDSFMKRIGVLEALSSYSVIINKPEALVYTRDKWRSLLRLARSGLPVPTTLLTENPFSAMRFCEKHRSSVYKPLMGSLGLGSTLVNDPDIAYHLTRSLMNIGLPSYYQVFLNKPGYDFRVFVVGDIVIGAMKRVVTVGWKTNIAQGAVGVGINCNEYSEVCEIAIKTTKILDLDYAGVDIAYDNNTSKYYVLEVNAFPHWIGLRTATGVDVAKHIVEYLIDKIKR